MQRDSRTEVVKEMRQVGRVHRSWSFEGWRELITGLADRLSQAELGQEPTERVPGACPPARGDDNLVRRFANDIRSELPLLAEKLEGWADYLEANPCKHEHTPFPEKPVPDAWYECPDCGMKVAQRGGRIVTVHENNEEVSRRQRRLDALARLDRRHLEALLRGTHPGRCHAACVCGLSNAHAILRQALDQEVEDGE